MFSYRISITFQNSFFYPVCVLIFFNKNNKFLTTWYFNYNYYSWRKIKYSSINKNICILNNALEMHIIFNQRYLFFNVMSIITYLIQQSFSWLYILCQTQFHNTINLSKTYVVQLRNDILFRLFPLRLHLMVYDFTCKCIYN